MDTFLKLATGGPGTALLRYALGALGGALIARGYLDAEAWAAIVGGIMAGVPAIIGAVAAKRVNVAARVAEMPGVAVRLPDGKLAPDAEGVKAFVAAGGKL